MLRKIKTRILLVVMAAVGTLLAQPVASNTTGRVKYEETFADNTALADWTIINADSSTLNDIPTVGRFTDTLSIPFSGNVAAKIPGTFFWVSNFSNAKGHLLDEWLISSKLPAVEIGDTLTFYAGSPGEADHDSIQVRLATVDPQGDISVFEHTLTRIRIDGPTGSWHPYKVALAIPDAIGKEVWVALRYWHTDGGPFGNHSDNIWIDHILITNNATTGIEDDLAALKKFELKQNYPNPFNPETEISYQLSAVSDVNIAIYNNLGQLITTLVKDRQSPGTHSTRWSGRDQFGIAVSSGVYFYQLNVTVAGATWRATRQMMLTR